MKLIKRILLLVCLVIVFAVPSALAATEALQDQHAYEKTITVRDDSGNVICTATLSANFYYNGTTSTCLSSDISVNVQGSGWSCSSQSATKSGNTAYGSFTIVKKFLFIVIDEETYNISITCDANGNIS